MKVKNFPFAISIDGFGAGPRQSINDPMGVRGGELHQWLYATEAFKKSVALPWGTDVVTKNVDHRFIEKAFSNVGAWIMGRNMFSPVRGPWPDESWKGWWNENPPFHCDVFVLTHHPRRSIKMAGDTTFHFVTDGIESALKKAKEAAKDKDVCIGGGISTIQQYLKARLIDEFHVAVTPLLFGEGENLFSNINLVELGMTPAEWALGEGAMHVVLKKT